MSLEKSLPKSWPKSVKSAILHVISLAHYSIVVARGWAANSINARARQSAQLDQAKAENSQLREQIRIKDARMGLIDPQHRPHYPQVERMAILELKASQGWSANQTARMFQVTAPTISSWAKRIDGEGPNPLVQIRWPVNRFPEFVRYIVRKLKVLCPRLGKVKLAQILARAGLHLTATTVSRIIREKPKPGKTQENKPEVTGKPRVVTAKYPNHVWHIDLTIVPIVSGFWATWLPFAFPQCWPFCWWVAVAIDHFSRRIMGVAVWEKQPTSLQVRRFLNSAFRKAGKVPKYIICDKGKQFWNGAFKRWCELKKTQPRFGAVGKHGSIAVVERFILSMKDDFTRRILILSRKEDFERQLALYVEWYNSYRPHTTLKGKTPDEAYFQKHPVCRYPRFEPRPKWPRGSPCAAPRVPVRGRAGVKIELHVRFLDGNRQLPIVELKRVA